MAGEKGVGGHRMGREMGRIQDTVLVNVNYLYLGFFYTLKNEMLYKCFENYLN